ALLLCFLGEGADRGARLLAVQREAARPVEPSELDGLVLAERELRGEVVAAVAVDVTDGERDPEMRRSLARGQGPDGLAYPRAAAELDGPRRHGHAVLALVLDARQGGAPRGLLDPRGAGRAALGQRRRAEGSQAIAAAV